MVSLAALAIGGRVGVGPLRLGPSATDRLEVVEVSLGPGTGAAECAPLLEVVVHGAIDDELLAQVVEESSAALKRKPGT